jgi:excinuclease UvrABC nuclease subunit
LCVRNLRYSLERRLGPPEPEALPSKRVNYRELIRRVYWRRVESYFEADVVYLDLARAVFPQTYQGMVGFRPAWFVYVNPEAEFPRYTRTTDPAGKPGRVFGPLEDKHSAARLVELLEDAFDLCRYYNILVEAPHGRACAYKEMGKCPAPCDGSISMPQYRRMIQWSAQTLADPEPFRLDQEQRMRAAAGELRFETAAKIKTLLDSVSQLGKGPFRFVRPLQDLAFLSLQRGPRARTAKLFLIVEGEVREAAGLIGEPAACGDLLRAVLRQAQTLRQCPLETPAVERLGVVSHHLFSAKSTQGVFLPLEQVTEKSLAKAFRDLQKQKIVEETGEGLSKELQQVGLPADSAADSPATGPGPRAAGDEST